jgi:hypothetical protein
MSVSAGALEKFFELQSQQNNRLIHKVTLSSLCLWASFHPYPLSQWYLQSKEILLNLGMKCWDSPFNA